MTQDFHASALRSTCVRSVNTCGSMVLQASVILIIVCSFQTERFSWNPRGRGRRRARRAEISAKGCAGLGGLGQRLMKGKEAHIAQECSLRPEGVLRFSTEGRVARSGVHWAARRPQTCYGAQCPCSEVTFRQRGIGPESTPVGR